MKLSEYYTVEQVSAFLGVKRSTVANAISRGIIKNEYFGKKKVVIHKNEIEQLKKSCKIRKKIIKRPSLKPGEYYTINQMAGILRITMSIIYDAIGLGIIKADYLDKKKIAIHESQIELLKAYRTTNTTDAKKKAQRELLAAGFKYSRNPPPGAPRGGPRHPSPFRRGWSKDGVYYALTAVETLHEWWRSMK
jgi:excisionase family DNA binding protein